MSSPERKAHRRDDFAGPRSGEQLSGEITLPTVEDSTTIDLIVGRLGGRLMATPSEVAEMLGMHPVHVRKLCRDGRLPAVQIGGRWGVSVARLAALMDGGEDLG